MVPIPPSRILPRISYFPSMSVDGCAKDKRGPPGAIVTGPARTISERIRGPGNRRVWFSGYNVRRMAATSSEEPAAAAEDSSLRTLRALFASLRPAQWTKNLVLPLPFLFGAALSDVRGWVLAAAGFGVFCVVSSGVYLINDVKDRERDRAHPVKRLRPLATGELNVATAVAAAVVLLAAGLLVAFR